MAGEVDAEPIGSAFGRRALLAEPEMKHIESAGAKTDGPHPAILLRRDDTRVLEHAEVLEHRRERDREATGERRHSRWPIRENLDNGAP